MFALDDLAQVVEDLLQLAVEASYTILYGSCRALEGLEVGEDFFPLWELSLPENQAALEKVDFAAIKARRSPEWSLEPPKQMRAAS